MPFPRKAMPVWYIASLLLVSSLADREQLNMCVIQYRQRPLSSDGAAALIGIRDQNAEAALAKPWVDDLRLTVAAGYNRGERSRRCFNSRWRLGDETFGECGRISLGAEHMFTLRDRLSR